MRLLDVHLQKPETNKEKDQQGLESQGQPKKVQFHFALICAFYQILIYAISRLREIKITHLNS